MGTSVSDSSQVVRPGKLPPVLLRSEVGDPKA